MNGTMNIITRQQAIEYLNSLGGDEPGSMNYWSLDSIRAEVLKGDEYDGMNIWKEMLEYYDAQDITD